MTVTMSPLVLLTLLLVDMDYLPVLTLVCFVAVMGIAPVRCCSNKCTQEYMCDLFHAHTTKPVECTQGCDPHFICFRPYYQHENKKTLSTECVSAGCLYSRKKKLCAECEKMQTTTFHCVGTNPKNIFPDCKGATQLYGTDTAEVQLLFFNTAYIKAGLHHVVPKTDVCSDFDNWT